MLIRSQDGCLVTNATTVYVSNLADSKNGTWSVWTAGPDGEANFRIAQCSTREEAIDIITEIFATTVRGKATDLYYFE